MPQYYDENGDPVEIPDPDDKPNFRRELERKQAEAEQRATAAEEKAVALERRIAFAEAGVPLSDPRAKYFVKGYEGELTAEAIQAEAATFGLTQAPASAIPEAERQALTTMGQAADGTAAPGARDFAAEYAAAAQLPPAEGRAAVARIAAEQGVQTV